MSDQQYLFFLYSLCQENSQHRFSLYKEPHMAGETALATLLRSMSPQLNDGDYVFCSVPDHRIPPGCEVIGSFHEQEGLTLILERQQAEQAGLVFDYVAAWITLNVHSALEAVEIGRAHV